MEKEQNEVEGFYLRCGEILNVPHTYDHQPRQMRRWNRKLGNGRYAGCGVIRAYGSGAHVCIRSPVQINRYFSTWEAVYEALEAAVRPQERDTHLPR